MDVALNTFKVLVHNDETFEKFHQWYKELPFKYQQQVQNIVKLTERETSNISHNVEYFENKVHHVIEVARCQADINYFVTKYYKPTQK